MQLRGEREKGREDTEGTATLKRPVLHDTSGLVAPLTAGQRSVVETLVNGRGGEAVSYAQAAGLLGLSVGTIHRQLKRVREHHPVTYSALMQLRRWQLSERHRSALDRARRHTAEWFSRKRARSYHAKWGCWPWDR